MGRLLESVYECCLNRHRTLLHRKYQFDDEGGNPRVQRQSKIQITGNTLFLRLVLFDNRRDLLCYQFSQSQDRFGMKIYLFGLESDRCEFMHGSRFVDSFLILDMLYETAVEAPVFRMGHAAKIRQVMADNADLSAEQLHGQGIFVIPKIHKPADKDQCDNLVGNKMQTVLNIVSLKFILRRNIRYDRTPKQAILI